MSLVEPGVNQQRMTLRAFFVRTLLNGLGHRLEAYATLDSATREGAGREWRDPERKKLFTIQHAAFHCRGSRSVFLDFLGGLMTCYI